MTDKEIEQLWLRVTGFSADDERADIAGFARALLATPAPLSDEPVAWRSKWKTGTQWTYSTRYPFVHTVGDIDVEPLYAAPCDKGADPVAWVPIDPVFGPVWDDIMHDLSHDGGHRPVKPLYFAAPSPAPAGRAALEAILKCDITGGGVIHAQKLARAALAAPLATPSVEPFPYQKTFDAIAAATEVQAGRVAISVIKFREAFGAAANPSDKQEAVAWIERCVLDEMRETNGGVSTVVYPKQGDPNYDEVPLYAAPLAQSAEQDRIDAEPHVRYCPSCGSIGPVEAKYRDCCPDGSDARMVPEKFAQKCRDTFHLAIDSIKGASK